MTPAAFALYKTSSGLSSYELLANKIVQAFPRPNTILDLACGDGYLIQYLLPKLNRPGNIMGVDMSEGELQLARKNYEQDPRVQFHLAKAQTLPLSDSSMDSIACHMAFMLMLPLDPVVSEIHRVLKSGGSFSAVIGDARGRPGLFSEIQKLTSQFIDACYPGFRDARSGDARVESETGIRELFSLTGGFEDAIDIFDFSLIIKTGPQGVWNLMKNMYFVTMLSQAEKRKLEKALKNFTLLQADAEKTVNFDFHMRMITVKKQ
jgi:ubiquinone/menaquinone biosynthesis C-methylase UbiE